MSFVEQAGVLSLVEALLQHSWPAELGPLRLPFQTMTFEEAMRDYGVDKPDTRFAMKVSDAALHASTSRFTVLSPCVRVSVQLMDLSDVFLSTDVQFLRSALSQPGGSIQAICVPSGMVRTFREQTHNALLRETDSFTHPL